MEAHGVGLAAAVDLDVHTLGQGVDDGRPHAVQAAGGAVGATAELPTGVQLGVDELDAGQAGGGLDVHGHSAPVVTYLDGTVVVDGHRDVIAVPLEGLIDGVVHDLPHAVHETALVGGADVHSRALAHGLEPLQDGEVAGGVVAPAGLVLR